MPTMASRAMRRAMVVKSEVLGGRRRRRSSEKSDDLRRELRRCVEFFAWLRSQSLETHNLRSREITPAQ